MTDNEIIKALECCINDDCEDCPLYGENAPDVYGNCVQNTKRNALDLINRQKAELIDTKAENLILLAKNEEAKKLLLEIRADLVEGMRMVQETKKALVEDVANAKTEAYKKFALKIKML